MEPNLGDALEFLSWLCPDGPWTLTAIRPDEAKDIWTKTLKSVDDVGDWLKRYAYTHNVYYALNPLKAPVIRKARTDDVASLAWLHVDVDPRAREDLAEERKRILAMLSDPKSAPRPSAVVDSGGGYQAFWRLEDPMRLDDARDVDEATRYNRQLELVLGADACHNVDRILRLPGTVNWPDARKRKKGRVPAATSAVFLDEATHRLSTFGKAAPSSTTAASKEFRHQVAVPTGNCPRYASLDDFPVKLPDRVKVIISLGREPDEGPKAKDDSRSAWLFDAVCAMVRAGASDEDVYSVITDPEWTISESVLDKGSGSERYALHQIQRAREATNASDDVVLNARTPVKSAREFVKRKAPTLRRYADEWLEYDGATYAEVEEQTIESRVYAFLDEAKTTVGAPEKGLTDFHPDPKKVNEVTHALRSLTHLPRGQVAPPCWIDGDGPPPSEIVACKNGLVHLPTRELIEPTPRFFTRNALDIDFDADAPEPRAWARFLKDLWPEDDASICALQEIFGYLLVPDTSQQKIFLIAGPPRSGKGTIARVLERLMGRHNVCAPTMPGLSGDFGLHPLIGKQLAIVSDMRLGPKTDQAAIAENLLRISGEDFVTVNRKYKDTWNGRLAVRFLILTNILPRFADPSKALANRFVPLMLSKSFLKQENPRLLDELLPELPGLLNWSIEGWLRLKARGRFKLTSAAEDAIQTLTDLSAPVAAFVDEECVLEANARETKEVLFSRYRRWCETRNVRPGTLDMFCRDLLATANVRAIKPREHGQRKPSFEGIRLRDEKEGPF
ncbi:MAG: hypothetical protein H6674_09295 [Dehalococcoidia bacterium]|nr:hypothetical protein [Dehalococcoidia bacterium]